MSEYYRDHMGRKVRFDTGDIEEDNDTFTDDHNVERLLYIPDPESHLLGGTIRRLKRR